MSDQTPDTHDSDDCHGFETRVAVDVMFEALSHIQASIDASTEEERVESYRKFKDALYARYEQLLEKRRAEQFDPVLEKRTNGKGRPEDGEEKDDGSDTLGKLWPTISNKSQTSDI